MAYIGQNFNSGDLKTYLTKYRSEASAYTIPVTTIDGAINLGIFPVSPVFWHPEKTRAQWYSFSRELKLLLTPKLPPASSTLFPLVSKSLIRATTYQRY